VNWEHLKAIAWLRWRLSRNQWERAGFVNGVLMTILTVGLLMLAGSSFFLALVLGVLYLPKASPLHLMYVWDGLVGLFVFGWVISLLTNIQRSELLSLDKFLHLPMTLRTAFVMNYLTTFLSLNVICILPCAIGLSLASAYSHGPQMLLTIPLVLAFIVMMTAFTYWIQGWIASLASNKRRQRSVIAAFTTFFIIICFLPSVIIQYSVHSSSQARRASHTEQIKLREELKQSDMPKVDQQRALQVATDKMKKRLEEDSAKTAVWIERSSILANKLIPIGWLPTGAEQLANRRVWPAGLCFLGSMMIGSMLLWRAYLATMKMYTRQASAQSVRSIKESERASSPPSTQWMERQVPWVSEQTSAVAISSLLGFIRAPESKMLLLAPAMFCVMFIGGTSIYKVPAIPVGLQPFAMQAGVGLLAFMLVLMACNVFGMDRAAFRSYVLMPICRRKILIGKNLAVIPVFLLMVGMVGFSVVYLTPISFLHCIAGLLQSAIVFLGISCLGNWISILFPIAMPISGSGKPMQVNLKAGLAQMVAMWTAPLIIVPGAIAIGIEAAIQHYLHWPIHPIYLVFSAVELVIAFRLYLRLIDYQAKLLQSREPNLIALLTSNLE
jgi:hypothetical protein